KTGAPYDLLLRPDAGEISPEQYKMVWLLGLLQLDKVESERIEKWRKAGITVMWTDGDGTRFFRPDSSGKDKINWTAAELRVLYAQAGVHIYNDSDDVTYAGRNWICIHSADGGERMVKLPFRAKIIRFPENKVVSMSANEATVVLPPKSTVLLRLHKVEE
ncbi:MAG: hypothetical protein LBD53_04040, partial [Tannerella sp.]|nr:hypothetical protein [Tannerella sp.]